jgi:signal transduction histidine kinase
MDNSDNFYLNFYQVIDFLYQKVEENLAEDFFFPTTLNYLADNLIVSACILLHNKNDSQQETFYSSQSNLNKQDTEKLEKCLKQLIKVYQKTLENNQQVLINFAEEKIPNELFFERKHINKLLLIPLIYRNKYFGEIVFYWLNLSQYLSDKSLPFFKIIAQYYTNFCYQNQLEKTLNSQQTTNNINTNIQQEKEEYFSHLSHEIRTPMSSIIGFSKILQQQLYGTLNAKQMQYVKVIYDSSTYLMDLINDFLDFSKLEVNKEELDMEEIEIEDICQSSLALFREKATQQGLNLNLIINKKIKLCYGDQRRLKQILVNLLSNAIKFTEQGFITLKVTQKLNNINFAVIDTGIGIKESDQSKLFKPFSQLHTPLHQKHKGTGLGLALSLELARLHGGDITLISQPGKGSCFTLHLPLKSTKKE